MMSRLVPSPDWFVGLDSVSLCDDGRWVERREMNAKIWDAGTDKGLTFTSPNWPQVPQKPIEEITSSRQKHPASSFHYNNLITLPSIATVIFSKKTAPENYQRDWVTLKGENLPNNILNKKLSINEDVKNDSSLLLEPKRQGELGTAMERMHVMKSVGEPVGKKATPPGGVFNGDPRVGSGRRERRYKNVKLSKRRKNRGRSKKGRRKGKSRSSKRGSSIENRTKGGLN